MSDQRVAVLLSCHGTVDNESDIPEFVRRIRRGRPAPPDVIEEVTRRFREIGGSPLMRVSHEQAAELEARLDCPVRASARLWSPSPRDAVTPLIEQGVKTIVSLPLAPQSVHVYNNHVREQLADLPVEIREATAYGLEPLLVGAFVEAIQEARKEVSADANHAILLTAHSLPLRVIAAGDPYQRDFEAMAQKVADALVEAGEDREAIHVAYQSQGMGGGDWLGPDLEATMRSTRSAGRDALLVAPIGFVAEHVETLYDIDVEADALARELGFKSLVRMPAMNTRPAFIAALEAVARALLR